MITPEQQFIIDVTVEMILNLPDDAVEEFDIRSMDYLAFRFPNEFNAAVKVVKERQQQQPTVMNGLESAENSQKSGMDTTPKNAQIRGFPSPRSIVPKE